MIRLGSKVRDKVSGYEGIATGETRWLTGCIRYTVEGPHKDGKRMGESFDEHHLEVLATPEETKIHPVGISADIEREALASQNALTRSAGASPGGPMPTPSRY